MTFPHCHTTSGFHSEEWFSIRAKDSSLRMYDVPRYSLRWGSLRLPLEPMPGIQRRLTMLSHLNGKKGLGEMERKKDYQAFGANLTRSRIFSSTWPQMSYGPFISKTGKQFKRQAICRRVSDSWGTSIPVCYSSGPEVPDGSPTCGLVISSRWWSCAPKILLPS